jgi:acetyl-CoA C-acetyltransferase
VRSGSTEVDAAGPVNGPDDARTPVIIAARRLATAKAGGAYSRLRVHELAAPVLLAVLDDSGVPAADVDDVILGNATGGGGNMARLAALTAGLPDAVPGLTVDRQCSSGLDAVVLAWRRVEARAGGGVVPRGGGEQRTGPGPRPPAGRRRPGVL